ncbi:MAG: carbohydrate binding family 9 domain-containing protein [Ignavibacteriae bacterium]|nr:carbohydrate binding family 9 domain-containing protein [Ignavibacteriota bacterium]
MNEKLVAILILVALAKPVLAGNSDRTITAVRVDPPIVLDGFVNEPEWQRAPPALDFTQFDPVEGALPTEVTSVRILYDDHALYVGVICYDARPGEVVPQLTRRDRTSEADRFTVQIDSYHDHQTAFVFSTNVSGVQSDGVLSQDGNVYDITWDAVWNVKTRWYIDGWSAEFEIPFNAIRFSPQRGESYEWGINFRRYISRKHETVEWVIVPRTEKLQIPHWGHVQGIKDISPPLNLSLIPYLSGTSMFESSTGGVPARSSHEALAGLDLKYGLTRDFTLDATFNPDFGQVEVDQAVLNLTVFETRFPEKRPFFVEGAQVFAFGTSVDNTSLPLFFSRRIGKRPSLAFSVAPPPGGSIEENPLVTTIIGAAKVTGHSGSGLSVGVLTAATDREKAVIRDSQGNRSEVMTEPEGSYNVVRIKQDMKGNSWFGGMATFASRAHTLPAFSGGFDWNLRFSQGTYTLDGFIAGAHSSATVTKRDGLAGKILFSKIRAEHWLYTLSYDFYTRYFNSNDLGFFAQPHDHGGYVQLGYRETQASGILRRYSFSVVPEARWNWDRVQTLGLIDATWSADYTNFWNTVLEYKLNLRAHDDAERGIIGIYRRPSSHSIIASIRTDERRNVIASLTTEYDFDEKKRRTFSTFLSLTLRPASWMELTPLAYYERTRNLETGVFSGGRIVSVSYAGGLYSLFAQRDLDELDVAMRGIITFTRTLSLQFYSQVLLARGKYDDYKLLLSSRQFVQQVAPSPGYDFNQIVFNANLLLRWEYLPGSTLYLVWTQGRFDNVGDYSRPFGTRLQDAFKLPHEDVLLLKVSYWLPL